MIDLLERNAHMYNSNINKSNQINVIYGLLLSKIIIVMINEFQSNHKLRFIITTYIISTKL